MPTFEAVPQDQAGRSNTTGSGQSLAIRKLKNLAHLLRALSASYVVWVLWRILSWWLDANSVSQNFGRFINRDLSTMASAQRFAALSLDLMAWTLLLMAVVYCWKSLSYLGQPAHWSKAAGRHLALCAWLAIACQVLTQLSRPVQSFLLTAHLPGAEQIWKWSFLPTDLMSIMFCLSLLMFAYVFTWTSEVAEENRSFV